VTSAGGGRAGSTLRVEFDNRKVTICPGNDPAMTALVHLRDQKRPLPAMNRPLASIAFCDRLALSRL
jgi:hypothetical protein